MIGCRPPVLGTPAQSPDFVAVNLDTRVYNRGREWNVKSSSVCALRNFSHPPKGSKAESRQRRTLPDSKPFPESWHGTAAATPVNPNTPAAGNGSFSSSTAAAYFGPSFQFTVPSAPSAGPAPTSGLLLLIGFGGLSIWRFVRRQDRPSSAVNGLRAPKQPGVAARIKSRVLEHVDGRVNNGRTYEWSRHSGARRAPCRGHACPSGVAPAHV
jgi:hypothetical protein